MLYFKRKILLACPIYWKLGERCRDISMSNKIFSIMPKALSVVVVVLVASFGIVQAVTYVGPTAIPPLGNLPQVIWNSESSGVTQTSASIKIDGDISAGGCMGRTFVGFTPTAYNGNRGGYFVADGYCNAAFAGSRVCLANEIMESLRCGSAAILSVANDSWGWVNAGPPGYVAYSNDCSGWTNASATAYWGRIWIFNSTNGGRGSLTVCSNAVKFACCK